MQGITVILIEDNKGLRDLMTWWLKAVTGCQIIDCEGVAELREKVRQIGAHDRVVLVTDGELLGSETCFDTIGFIRQFFGERMYDHVLLVSGKSRRDWDAVIMAARHMLGLEVEYHQKSVSQEDLERWWKTIRTHLIES